MPKTDTSTPACAHTGRFALRVSDECRAGWDAHAVARNETLSVFLRRAADEQMVRDRVADKSRAARAACKRGVFPEWEK